MKRAKLLPDPQLSSWARIALEAIPGAEADAALLEATGVVEGRLLVGVINSIGVRRDPGAVDSLAAHIEDDDAAVASAAAVALGHIGTVGAARKLTTALVTAPADARSAIAEGCVLAAERFHTEGNSAAAIHIYDLVREANVPLQRTLEATRGAILVRNNDGIPLLLEELRSLDQSHFRLALTTAREFPGGEIDKALVTELQQAEPERGALIVQAMADRPDTVILSAILDSATDGPLVVRLSAIEALRRVGDESCLDSLLTIAAEDDADLVETAKATLAELPGESVDERISALLPDAEGTMHPILLEVVGRRRIDAIPHLLKAVKNSDDAVRHAALIALGETVPLSRLSLLIAQVIRPGHPADRPIAEQALLTASVRMPDRNACSAELASAVKEAPSGVKTTILEILNSVGGPRALQALSDAAKSGDPELLDTSSRLLGRWNSVDAAPVLLDLATTSDETKYQIRALRGYIGLARKFSMPDAQRADMCQKALDAASRPEEKKLVIDVLKIHPSVEGLAVAIHLSAESELQSAANQAVSIIADDLARNNVDVARLLSEGGFSSVDLEILSARYGAGTTQTDVTDELRKLAGDLPLISLNAKRYNDRFGGDPAPGLPKQLTIRYRMNGKEGESSFPEDSLIFLPMPE